MRICFFILLLISSFAINAQKKYACIYRDSTAFVMIGKSFDSLKANLKTNASDQGIPPEILDAVIEQVALKMSEQETYKVLERKVFVGGDTAVLYWSEISSAGNLKTEDLPDSMMMVNDQLYGPASSPNGFSTKPADREKRNFHSTGKIKTILNYPCKEYLSTDSACRIWTTEELPSSINPGIITNGVAGAVLAFEIVKLPIYKRCEIVELGDARRRVTRL